MCVFTFITLTLTLKEGGDIKGGIKCSYNGLTCVSLYMDSSRNE